MDNLAKKFFGESSADVMETHMSEQLVFQIYGPKHRIFLCSRPFEMETSTKETPSQS